MTNAERLAKMQLAWDSLREVLHSLNNAAKSCDCCKRTIYENWEEHLAHDTLTSSMTRIDKVINQFGTIMAAERRAARPPEAKADPRNHLPPSTDS